MYKFSVVHVERLLFDLVGRYHTYPCDIAYWSVDSLDCDIIALLYYYMTGVDLDGQC